MNLASYWSKQVVEKATQLQITYIQNTKQNPFYMLNMSERKPLGGTLVQTTHFNFEEAFELFFAVGVN